MLLKMLSYPITTNFQDVDRFHPTSHTGVDFACPAGTPAQSITDGIISKVANDPMLGDNIRVNATAGHEWVYGHLCQVNVTTGQRVNAGDLMGLTGGVPGTPGAGHSTGAHLHLSLLKDGSPVDPLIALASSEGGSGWWDKFGEALFTQPHVPTASERILDWIGSGLTMMIHIMPEICGLLAMIFLLVGMVGSRRAMRYAGTSVLLAFVGVMLDAAIQPS